MHYGCKKTFSKVVKALLKSVSWRRNSRIENQRMNSSLEFIPFEIYCFYVIRMYDCLIYSITNYMAYGTRRFNAAFTRALQYSLSWAKSTQFFLLIPICLRSILILSSHLFFPAGLPVNILKALLPSSSGYMPCPSQFCRFNHPVYIRWTVQIMKFLIVTSLKENYRPG